MAKAEGYGLLTASQEPMFVLVSFVFFCILHSCTSCRNLHMRCMDAMYACLFVLLLGCFGGFLGGLGLWPRLFGWAPGGLPTNGQLPLQALQYGNLV